MNTPVNRLGLWSAIAITVLVILIDVGMIVSALLYPMTSINNIEAYANLFTSTQMLPFIPSLMLAPVFVIMIACINHWASQEKKILSQIAFSFAVICGAILGIHYYIQLTFVQQNILSNQLTGLWQFVAPNPHSFFWTFAALGYGFMGLSVLFVAPIFSEKSDRAIKWLLLANGIIGIVFLIGNALGVFAVNILASLIWGILFPIASVFIAKKYKAQSIKN